MRLYRTTYHRDGTVTIWDVYSQTWCRVSAHTLANEGTRPHSAMLMPTLSPVERARIERMAATTGTKS